MYLSQPDGHHQLHEVSRAALAAPASPGPPRLTDLLLDGFSLLVTEGRAAAEPTLRQALATFRSEDLPPEKGLLWGTLTAVAAATLWDFESSVAIYRRQSDVARKAGALAPLCLTLSGEVYMMVLRGELTAATALAGEVDTLTDAIGLPHVPQGGLLVAAFSGDEPDSSAYIRAAIDLASARNEGSSAQVGRWAQAILFNGLGRYQQALSAAQLATTDVIEWMLTPWVLPELIEAAVRTGNNALAIDALERLDREHRDRARTTGAGAFLHEARPWSATTTPRASTTARPLSASAAPGYDPTKPGHTCSTANGYGARTAVPTHATSCAAPTTCSARSGCSPLPTARSGNSERPERPSESDARTRAMTSHPKRN